jgi:hypothetical protein
MERAVVHPYIKCFIVSQSLHDSKGPSFRCHVVVINPTQETVALSVINQPTSVIEYAQFALLKSTSIKGFMGGTILFQWH